MLKYCQNAGDFSMMFSNDTFLITKVKLHSQLFTCASVTVCGVAGHENTVEDGAYTEIYSTIH